MLLSTLTVVNDRDSGPGSLPQEVALAGSGDTIAFAPGLAGHTIHLTSPLNFNGNLTLRGSRTGGLTIVDGSGVAMNDTGGNLVIKDMSIVGAIHVVDGNVEVHDSTISGGHASQGGGIYVLNGNLEINHSTIIGNTAIQGGGIYAAGGNVEINHSFLANNTAIGTAGGTGAAGGDAMGGGMYFAGSNMEINHTDFSGNLSLGGRGGNGAARTFTAVAGQNGGNGGNGLGGGIFITLAGIINLDHDSFSQNMAQGGAGGTGGAGALGAPGSNGIHGADGNSGGAIGGNGTAGTDGGNGKAGGSGGHGGSGGYGEGGGPVHRLVHGPRQPGHVRPRRRPGWHRWSGGDWRSGWRRRARRQWGQRRQRSERPARR